MDDARSKHENAHHHRWNLECWDTLPVVRAEDGIEEFVDELGLRFVLFDDTTQIRPKTNQRRATSSVKSPNQVSITFQPKQQRERYLVPFTSREFYIINALTCHKELCFSSTKELFFYFR